MKSPLLILAGILCLVATNAATPVHHPAHKRHVVHHTRPADTSPTVWVNLPTGIYHYQGERWYGRTKDGTFMSERQAIADGYRATENGQ